MNDTRQGKAVVGYSDVRHRPRTDTANCWHCVRTRTPSASLPRSVSPIIISGHVVSLIKNVLPTITGPIKTHYTCYLQESALDVMFYTYALM